jgi:hypothetical protein
LAFDLYYKYMSAAEQEFLMSTIARLKDEGRVEALRETRDNIHVYVFGSGRPPDETLVTRVLEREKAAKKGKNSGVARRQPRGPTRSKKRAALSNRLDERIVGHSSDK